MEEVNLPCACAEEICRSGSISKNHQLTNLNKCGKFHACIRKSTILALSRLANNMDQRRMILGSIIRLCMDIVRYSARIVIILITDYRYDDDTGLIKALRVLMETMSCDFSSCRLSRVHFCR